MTLPKGFGSGRNCPSCGIILFWDNAEQDYVCKYTKCSIGRGDKNDNSIDIPLTRWDIGRFFFYLGFYGGVVSLLLLGNYGHSELELMAATLGTLGLTFSTLVGWVCTDPWNNDRSWNKRKQLFFIFVPISKILNRISLKK